MEVLGNRVMTASRLLASTAVFALALVVTGCTDGQAPKPSASSSSESRSPSSTAPSAVEDEQGKRAKAAVAVVPPDDPMFLESGLERVADGVHRQSMLEQGENYKLSVACAGQGSMKVVIRGKVTRLPCGGGALSLPIERAPAQLPIDISPEAGASGMIAWQITRVSAST
ncbi:hypothetical protein ACQI4E_00810 [Streptomyces sp. CA-252508]|uniref:hypothetical protein n=1 Tax=Streptomyces sp. CA-252508 TaxID=3418946 RepID=UPI003D8E3A18